MTRPSPATSRICVPSQSSLALDMAPTGESKIRLCPLSARMLCPLPDRPRFMSPWMQACKVQVARRVTLLCAAPVKPRNVPRRAAMRGPRVRTSRNGVARGCCRTAPAHIFITQIVRSPANQGL